MARRVSQHRDPWSAMFPASEAQRATRFLVDTWNTIIRKSPQHFSRRRTEPQLTEKFWWYLESTSRSLGRLMGQWTYEKHHYEFDPKTGKQIKRIRLDICYFSNAGTGRLDLTYEFKKLKAKGDSWRAYQGVNGLRRFVDGYYAKHQPVAAMVAMMIDEPKRCIDGLRRSLLVDGTRDSLKMMPDANGHYIREPSVLFAGAATFDTEHKRPDDQAPKQGTTCVAHVFLSLPPEAL